MVTHTHTKDDPARMRSNQALEGGAPQVISLSYFIYKLQLPIESYRYIMIIYHRPQLRTNSACLHSGITLCQVVTLKAALKPSGQGSLILLLVLLGVLVATSKLLENAGNSTLGILQDVDLPCFYRFFSRKNTGVVAPSCPSSPRRLELRPPALSLCCFVRRWGR